MATVRCDSPAPNPSMLESYANGSDPSVVVQTICYHIAFSIVLATTPEGNDEPSGYGEVLRTGWDTMEAVDGRAAQMGGLDEGDGGAGGMWWCCSAQQS